MQYNYRGIYDISTHYEVKDVVSYRPTENDTVKYYFCLTANTGQLPTHGIDNQYWGIVNALSNFPNAVDTFTNRTPIQASDKPNLARFQELSLKSSLSPSEQDELNTLTQTLRNKLILSDDFNALQDSISNMQMFLNDSVIGYINQKYSEFNAKIEKFDDKGDYNSSTTYMKNNFVRYNYQTYICLNDNIVNVTPSDDGINWRLMAQRGAKGEQGLPGLNLVFRNTYDPLTSYVLGDAVEYGGSIFYAKQPSTGETPTANGISWNIFMPRASVSVSHTPPPSPTDKQVWIDTNTGIFKWYDANSSSWISTNADNANKLGGQLPSYYATAQDLSDINNKQEDLVESVNEVNQKVNDAQTTISNHQKESMPHQFTDVDNKTYRYGFKTNANKDGLIFVYEEV